MNGGKFDGGALAEDQKQLRQFYSDILTFANANQAIANGDYFDLTTFNIQAGNINSKIHAFVRNFEDEKLIIVSGFNDKTQSIKIQIPQEVAKQLQLNAGETYMARDLLRSGTEIGFSNDLSFIVDLPAFSSYIFKIK